MPKDGIFQNLKSQIVYPSNSLEKEEKRGIEKAKLLIEKYILDGRAEFEINISSRCRQKLQDLFYENSSSEAWKSYEGKLGDVFDEAMKQLRDLLNDSFMRWKRTDSYYDLCVCTSKAEASKSPGSLEVAKL